MGSVQLANTDFEPTEKQKRAIEKVNNRLKGTHFPITVHEIPRFWDTILAYAERLGQSTKADIIATEVKHNHAMLLKVYLDLAFNFYSLLNCPQEL